ncbi:hypothetical protein DBV15_02052 [Temnothorax longispinosus]|uniref:Uncharacterized protein n=1 Tax=Temnothorax longispinosus TaxID=300112 RepID=A0A4S2KK55_9HYME|nr:hypothetical protein DBV15_02052 [Temnothorax longispinosus]
MVLLQRLRLPDLRLRMQLRRILGLKRLLLLLLLVRAAPSGPSDAVRIEHEHHDVDQEPYQGRQQYHLTRVNANLGAEHLSTASVFHGLYHELITQSARAWTRDTDFSTRGLKRDTHNRVLTENGIVITLYSYNNVCTFEFENNVLLPAFKVVPRPDNTGNTMKIAVSYVYTVITAPFYTGHKPAYSFPGNGERINREKHD